MTYVLKGAPHTLQIVDGQADVARQRLVEQNARWMLLLLLLLLVLLVLLECGGKIDGERRLAAEEAEEVASYSCAAAAATRSLRIRHLWLKSDRAILLL